MKSLIYTKMAMMSIASFVLIGCGSTDSSVKGSSEQPVTIYELGSHKTTTIEKIDKQPVQVVKMSPTKPKKLESKTITLDKEYDQLITTKREVKKSSKKVTKKVTKKELKKAIPSKVSDKSSDDALMSDDELLNLEATKDIQNSIEKVDEVNEQVQNKIVEESTLNESLEVKEDEVVSTNTTKEEVEALEDIDSEVKESIDTQEISPKETNNVTNSSVSEDKNQTLPNSEKEEEGIFSTIMGFFTTGDSNDTKEKSMLDENSTLSNIVSSVNEKIDDFSATQEDGVKEISFDKMMQSETNSTEISISEDNTQIEDEESSSNLLNIAILVLLMLIGFVLIKKIFTKYF
jgi:uncharacterized protein YcfL